jgi:hypothetical protein
LIFLSLLLIDISRIISYINKGVELNQPRLLQRAIRQNAFIRRNATKELLSRTITKFIPATHPTFQSMLDAVGNLPATESEAEAEASSEKMSLDGTDEDEPCAAVIPEVEVGVNYSMSAFHFCINFTALCEEKIAGIAVLFLFCLVC